MGQPGIGVMLGYLSGNESSVRAWQSAVNKVIAEIRADEDSLHFVMEDGTKIKLSDEGQSCCEHRYMTTDDDLSYHVGTELIDSENKDATSIEMEYEEHEVQFLEVKTSKGVISCANHNEHNGYYGGFYVQCAAE